MESTFVIARISKCRQNQPIQRENLNGTERSAIDDPLLKSEPAIGDEAADESEAEVILI